MTLQQKKSRRFADALKAWDAFKAEIERAKESGRISEAEAKELLSVKAKELDL